MSKCDLQIIFDRADRTYRGGEEVSGTVHVRVNQDVQCDGLRLERFWQTHGRGNTATGYKHASLLFQGQWRAGESFSYPFRFMAPDGPPTYRGRYLNVDHYVNVRVDVPWAIDPKRREEYVLLPGDRPYGNVPTARTSQLLGGQWLSKYGMPVAIGMLVIGVLVIFPLGIFLIPAGLLLLFFSLRKSLAEKKIGKVAVRWSSLSVPPAASVPLRVSFTPRQSSRLNRITAKLVGVERCVSGSGTNKTTHTHKLHERTVLLAPECDVTAYQPIQVEGAVPIPETNAFSFSAKDNSLIWELEVRVDIPLWPDWVEKRAVTVRPPAEAEIVEAVVVEPAPSASAFDQPVPGWRPGRAGPETIALSPDQIVSLPPAGAAFAVSAAATGLDKPSDDRGTEAPSSAQQPAGPEPPAPEAPPAAAATPTDAALIEIIDRLVSTSRYGREREEIIGQHAEQSFRCGIEIAKVDRTYSYIPDHRFRKGRTATGVLAGTEHKVSLQLVDSRNEELDSLKPGDTVCADCKLLKWNTVYDRLEMREA